MTRIHPKYHQVTSLVATYDNRQYKRTGKTHLRELVEDKIVCGRLSLAHLERLNRRMSAGASVMLSTRILRV